MTALNSEQLFYDTIAKIAPGGVLIPAMVGIFCHEAEKNAIAVVPVDGGRKWKALTGKCSLSIETVARNVYGSNALGFPEFLVRLMGERAGFDLKESYPGRQRFCVSNKMRLRPSGGGSFVTLAIDILVDDGPESPATNLCATSAGGS